MTCAHLAPPASPSFEDIRLFAFDTVQRYEICAARHNACALKLEKQADEK
jgi:hypothetical protein